MHGAVGSTTWVRTNRVEGDCGVEPVGVLVSHTPSTGQIDCYRSSDGKHQLKNSDIKKNAQTRSSVHET